MNVKRFVWAAIPLLLMAVGATGAKADTFYTINFSSSYGDSISQIGPLPTSGTVDYDAAGNTITATIVWEGQTFAFNTADITGEGALFNGGPCAGANQAAVALNQLEGCTGYFWWYANETPPSGPYFPDYTGAPGVNYFSLDAGGSADIRTTVTAAAINGLTAQGDLTISLTPSVTPETSTLALTVLGAGLAGLLAAMRKRKAQKPAQAG